MGCLVGIIYEADETNLVVASIQLTLTMIFTERVVCQGFRDLGIPLQSQR